MATENRIYVVEGRLIAAPSLARAKAHVARKIQAKLASQNDLIKLVGEGVKVEDSTKKEEA